MNNAWRGKCSSRLRHTQYGPAGNETHNYKLQSNQSARSQTNDHIKAVPFGKLSHPVTWSLLCPVFALYSRPGGSLETLYGRPSVAAPAYATAFHSGAATEGRPYRGFILAISSDSSMVALRDKTFLSRKAAKPPGDANTTCFNGRSFSRDARGTAP